MAKNELFGDIKMPALGYGTWQVSFFLFYWAFKTFYKSLNGIFWFWLNSRVINIY